MRNIKTSVIIPVYNTEKYIEECLNSVLRQTQKEVEIIVVDDGSVDGSIAIAEEIAKENDNIIIIHQKNCGLGAARNAGMKKARGKYIYFLDSDDFIDERLLEKCFSCAEENRLEGVLFDASIVWENEHNVDNRTGSTPYDRRNIISKSEDVFKGKNLLQKYASRKKVVTSACLMYLSRDFMAENNVIFPEGILFEDIAWCFGILLSAKRLQYLPEFFYHRRIRENSIITSAFTERHLEGILVSCEEALQYVTEKGDSADKDGTHIIMGIILSYADKAISESLKCSGETAKRFISLIDRIRKDFLNQEVYDECNFLYKLYSAFEKCFPEYNKKYQVLYKEIAEKRNNMLKGYLSELPFGIPGKTIGIYGLGRHSNLLLAEYEKLLGKMKADIFFIDSDKISGAETFHGYDICNVRSIDSKNPDCIIISSILYEEEIEHRIRQLYDKKYPIIRFYEKRKWNLF